MERIAEEKTRRLNEAQGRPQLKRELEVFYARQVEKIGNLGPSANELAQSASAAIGFDLPLIERIIVDAEKRFRDEHGNLPLKPQILPYPGDVSRGFQAALKVFLRIRRFCAAKRFSTSSYVIVDGVGCTLQRKRNRSLNLHSCFSHP